MAQVKRKLPIDLRLQTQQQYVRPFHLVRLDFEQASQYLSTGPEVVLENRLAYSEDLSQLTPWGRVNIQGVPTKDAWVDPEGELSLTKVIADTVSQSARYLDYSVTGLADNQIVSCALVAKKGEYDFAKLDFVVKNGSGPSLSYQFSTKTITTQSQGTGNTGIIFEVEELGPELVRLVMRNINVLTGATVPRFRPRLQSANPLVAWTGNGTDGTLYGAAQLWFGAEKRPYVKSGAAAYGSQTYIAGLVDVGDQGWDPDGGQTAQIELYNENNAAVALVLNTGVAEVPCTLYDCYVKPDGTPTSAVITASGVLTDSDITPTSTIVSMSTVKAGVEFQPSRYCTPAEGFNWLPPEGAQITWGSELYIFERE